MKNLVALSMIAVGALTCAGGELVESLACEPQVQYFDGVATWWLQRFDAKRAECDTNAEVNVVFLGDSITHNWERPEKGRAVWDANFARGRYAAVNCGISSERTENLIWRIEHGQFGRRVPKAFVLMIGTNNIGSNTPEEIAKGIEAIVRTAAKKHPEAKILLLPIFPRDANADGPSRVKVDRVNAIIRGLADGRHVLWCDFTDKLKNPDGTIRRDLFRADCLHLTTAGYGVWAREMKPHYDAALGRMAR